MRKLILLGLLLAFASVVSCSDMSSQPLPTSTVVRTISVSGNAEIKVIPDQMIIYLNVETWDKLLSVSKKQNDTIVRKVLALAEKYKIEPKYFQTSQFTVYPTYNDKYSNSGVVTIAGYRITKSIIITLNNLELYENLISDAIEAGVNYVNNIQYQTTELRKHRDEARKQAIRAAKEKAEALCKELGVKVGKPQYISETSSFYNPWGQRNYQNVMMDSNAGGGAEMSPTTSPGEISVSAIVSVTFDIE